jgi:membrane-bound lytic murein transglycosylase B
MKFYKLLFLILLSINIYANNIKNPIVDYSSNLKTIEFIDMMVKKYNFDKKYLQDLFSSVQKQLIPLKIISRKRKKPTKAIKKKYPKYGAWDRYIKTQVTKKRILAGKKYLKKYRSTFKKVEKKYGIPKEYLVAIIGIESLYGKNVGKFPTFDTLATLSFEKNRRNKFFTKQLRELLILTNKYKINIKNILGSYAGAIGLGQFMPSNYEAYGVDFNKDGKISLLHPLDAIASIANYLKQNGWKKGEVVATRVSYKGTRFNKYKTGYNTKYNRNNLKGISPKNKNWHHKGKVRLIKLNKKNYDELWYGAKNFYVITRYNHSAYYAMSIHQLAQAIKNHSK